MTFAARLAMNLFTALYVFSAFAENTAMPVEEIEVENGWQRLTTDEFSVQFPTKPSIDKQGSKTTYTSLDTSTFPVVLYMLSVMENKEPIDAEACVNNRIETLSNKPLKLLWHEIVDSGDTITIDSLCADTKTRVMRNERMLVGKNRVYTLTTLFFPTSAENHDIFVHSFTNK